MTGREVLVSVRDVTKVFPLARSLWRGRRSLHAVRGVSLEVRRGECLAIVGESGSGKTTLASIVLGLEAPTSGEILIGGRPVKGFARRELARWVQPIFQDPYASLNPRQRIRTIVELPLRVGGQISRQAVSEIIERVGLAPSVLESYPSQLSGGQRQRVAIARALVSAPSIVVCDEPTSALDVSIQAQILNLLRDLQDDLGLTYLFISHDLGVVAHIADRVAIMQAGEIVETGPVASVFEAPRHPYTRALLGSILDIDAKPGRAALSNPQRCS